MNVIVAHSFRGGTGKTNVIANLSLSLAESGYKVGVIDSDITHPSLHINFGFGEQQLKPTLTEFLLGRCDSESMVHNISLLYPSDGQLYLIPSNLDEEVISLIMKKGFDLGTFYRGLREIEKKFGLDFLLIDTSPGLDERTLLILSLANVLLILLRNDEADIRGTETLLRIVDNFKITHKYMVPNMIAKEHLPKIKNNFTKRFKSNRVQLAEPLCYSRKLFVEHAPQVDHLFIYQYPEALFSKSIANLKKSILEELSLI